MADTYQVINQRPDVQIADSGVGFQDVWHITYKVTSGPGSGTTGVVTVTDANHNAAYIKGAIEDKIGHIQAIANL